MKVVKQLDILIANLAEIYRTRTWCFVPLRQKCYVSFDLGTFKCPRSTDTDRTFGIPSGTVRAHLRQFYRSQNLVTDPPAAL